MFRKLTITVLSLAAVACCFPSDANAQLFKKAKARKAQRYAIQQQNSLNPTYGQPNMNVHGGLPLHDSVPGRPASRSRLRDSRILKDGSLQWVPRAHSPTIQYFPPAVYTPPPTPTRSPYAAGPTVGGPVRIRVRPQPQETQPTRWQPWMHVPLDGSQRWNQ